MLDGRSEADYAYAQSLSAAQWAWEFLRRNAHYRQEYREFIRVWRELEVAYGVPPERDFQAWKNDLRAYVLQGEAGSDGCRVDADKVLIECALGARWGFYQFPNDPDLSAPELEREPVWRELDSGIAVIGVDDARYLGDEAACVALGFDLSLPLAAQLEQARLKLGALKAARQRSGSVQPRTLRALQSRWVRYLRVLDAERAGVASDTAPSLTDAECVEMRYLCAQGYREILRYPAG